METILEQQRRYHEEKERLMDVMVKEMLTKKSTVRLRACVRQGGRGSVDGGVYSVRVCQEGVCGWGVVYSVHVCVCVSRVWMGGVWCVCV